MRVLDEFYYTDCSDEKWVDGGGLYSEAPSLCVQCLENTHRVDVAFEAFLCTGCEPIFREAYAAAIHHE